MANTPGRRITIGQLYRGRARLSLIRDLAMGEWSNAEIARSLDIPTGDVAAFASEHAEEISEVRAALAGKLAIETAGLWITKKQNRLAEIQSDLEDTAAEIAAIRDASGPNFGVGSRKHYNLIRIRLALLGAAANEIEPRRTGPRPVGETPSEENVVHYVIEADDITAALS